MQNLRYVGKNLFIEKLSIKNILKKQKTPFYIYSENQIVTNFLKFKNTFKKTNPLICFAAKSNSNLNILRVLGKLGAGAPAPNFPSTLSIFKLLFDFAAKQIKGLVFLNVFLNFRKFVTI